MPLHGLPRSGVRIVDGMRGPLLGWESGYTGNINQAARIAWESYATEEPAVIELLLLAANPRTRDVRFKAMSALEWFDPATTEEPAKPATRSGARSMPGTSPPAARPPRVLLAPEEKAGSGP